MKIEIIGLKVKTIIGVYEWEREAPIELIMDLFLEYNADIAIETDNVRHAVDYDVIYQKIHAICANGHYLLLEKLVDVVLNEIMQDKRIIAAEIKITKPNCLENCTSVSVSDKYIL